MGRPALISACAYVDSQAMDEITILQAEVLKTLASPRRIDILHALAAGPIEVGRLAKSLGASQPNVSQHLAVLRGAGIVEAEREGREVRYRLVDPDVMIACGLMRAVLERRLTRLGELATGGTVAPGPATPGAASMPISLSNRSAPR
jgi:DNA-binding transcriptional ArsR family regulator